MKFIFTEERPKLFDCPVDVRLPGGETQTFTARFEELDAEEIAALTGGERADADLVRRVLVDWHDVVDDAGTEVEFTTELRDRLLTRPYARYAIASAYYRAILGEGRDRGN